MKLIKASRMLSFMAFAAIASSTALADDSGWYLGANVGQSKSDIDDDRITKNLLQGGFSTTSIDENNRDTGFKLLGGYQFNRYVSVESGYFDLGKFDFTAQTLPLGTLTGEIKLKGINVDIVGFVPFTEKLSAFGRVGVNYADTKDSFHGTGAVNVVDPEASQRQSNLKLGLGLQYDFNDVWAMRLETERYRINDAVGNKGDVDFASVGIVYRFGTTPPPAPIAPVIVEPIRAPVVIAVQPPPARRFVKTTLSANELFAFDSAEVRLPQPQLDVIAKALRGEGAPNRIVISGYTDRLGSDAYNQKLSERRALGVKNYMISKGVEPERLIAEGRGEVDPVVECKETNKPLLIKCLTPNRRVEIDEMTIVKEVKK
jgi:OmpA-OmpF porin, OOP family